MGEFRGATTQRMKALTDQRLLTKAYIERVYSISGRTIDRLIGDGTLTPVRVGKVDRIAESDWLSYLAGHRARTASH